MPMARTVNRRAFDARGGAGIEGGGAIDG